jgi:NitT/TauT family transport system permease protein
MLRHKLPLSGILVTAVAGAGFVLLWYLVRSQLSADYKFLLPAPDAVIGAMLDNFPALFRATCNTVTGALLGFVLAVIAGFSAALLLSLSPLVRIGLTPWLMLLQLTPIPILAPLFVLWVGPGLKSVTLITFLVCFFPLAVNTTQGLISADRQLVELFQMWRARRWQEIWLLRVPAALPYFFTGLRIAAVLAPIGAVIGDYSAGSSAGDGGGLGFQALIYSMQAKYPALFAVVAITSVLGFLFLAAVLLLSRTALGRWHDSYRSEDA